VPEKPGSDDLGLRDAAERLGVHYMTAYRYVRLGLLPATKVAGEWRVNLADIEDLTQRQDSAPGAGGLRWPRYRSQLRDRLLRGDEPGAWAVIEQALTSGGEPREVLLELLSPVLVQIGDEWETGGLEVADEHRASSVATRLIGRLGPSFARRGRKRGAIVIGAAADDHHSIPSAILGDVLRGEGFEVIDLGADTPRESFLRTAMERDDLVAVAISAGWDGALDNARAVATELHDQVPGLAVFLGGPAISGRREARQLGADEYGTNALEVANRCTELAKTAKGAPLRQPPTRR
jgi:excisionase family DNA binding protein